MKTPMTVEKAVAPIPISSDQRIPLMTRVNTSRCRPPVSPKGRNGEKEGGRPA